MTRERPPSDAGSVVDDAIDRIKRRIGTGEFAPGHKLPPEATLARELELSRLSLREAVRALVMAGVLEVRHGAGTFVTDLRPDRMVDAIGGFLQLSHDTGVGELFECRRVLEPGATALAATRIDQATLDVLAGQIERMRGLRDPEEMVAEDLAFHATIVAAAGNRTLHALASTVAQRTARARVWRAMAKDDVWTRTHQQHLDIYFALRDRDSMAAFVAATRHVADVEAWVQERLRGLADG
jgi:GntR family transcriptional regulator, transcriptional repressor for pyruvate dehydrogenase complex